jgi:hypothetical protein
MASRLLPWNRAAEITVAGLAGVERIGHLGHRGAAGAVSLRGHSQALAKRAGSSVTGM